MPTTKDGRTYAWAKSYNGTVWTLRCDERTVATLTRDGKGWYDPIRKVTHPRLGDAKRSIERDYGLTRGR